MPDRSDDRRQTGLVAEPSTRYSPPPCPRVDVAGRERPDPGRFDWQQRLTLAFFGAGLLALLAVAAVLQPDRSGFGTHQQLGLPDCTFLVLFGYRCPSCGMTTSWAHLVRGELSAAAAANAGGTLLGMLAMMTGPWALISAARGRHLGGLPSSRALVTVVLAVVVVTLADWVWRVVLA